MIFRYCPGVYLGMYPLPVVIEWDKNLKVLSWDWHVQMLCMKYDDSFQISQDTWMHSNVYIANYCLDCTCACVWGTRIKLCMITLRVVVHRPWNLACPTLVSLLTLFHAHTYLNPFCYLHSEFECTNFEHRGLYRWKALGRCTLCC